ncbi:TLD-domain-containing protein [Choanephora cucurbitarum]|nr:TLD-domain-containing protein [Choanephora cucurbitarum]
MSLPVLPTTMVRLTNRHPSTFVCLEKVLAQNIQTWLPSRISISSQWSLVYSLDQHGASLNTLYNRCKLIHGPCLLVIQDSHDQIFGAYLSEGIHVQSNCYGTGECFLWKKDKKTDRVEIYPWTSANDYLIYSDHDFFAMGGGQGQFGLWLHSDLTHGNSQTCATFNNPVLSSMASFECIAIEIWDFTF